MKDQNCKSGPKKIFSSSAKKIEIPAKYRTQLEYCTACLAGFVNPDCSREQCYNNIVFPSNTVVIKRLDFQDLSYHLTHIF